MEEGAQLLCDMGLELVDETKILESYRRSHILHHYVSISIILCELHE
jgi:hypothetical protein